MFRALRPWTVCLLMACLALIGARPAAALDRGMVVRHALGSSSAAVGTPSATIDIATTHTRTARAALPAPSPRQLFRRACSRRHGRELATTGPAATPPGSNSAARALKCRASDCQGPACPWQRLTDGRPSAPRAPPSQA
jgi:hypothetical protein